jgi:thiamine biosynthesis lipoprotein
MTHTFRHQAMATSFELHLSGCPEDIAASAAAAVFSDIDELESEISRYQPGSDLTAVRGLSSGQSLRIGLATYDCLSLAKDVAEATNGAFDCAVANLWEAWRTPSGSLAEPDETTLADVRARSGSHLFTLDPNELTITVHCDHLGLDLGGIGKGYALDQAAEILLEDFAITRALLNAGESTVLALQPPEGSGSWVIGAGAPGQSHPLTDGALSGSGFSVQGSHIIDPRSGRPVPLRPDREHVWALAPTAALADALSTAFMVMTPEETAAFCRTLDGVGSILLEAGDAE